MDILTLVEAINKYGFEVVIAAIFLGIYLRNEYKRSKRAEEESKKRTEDFNNTIDKLFQKLENSNHLTLEQESLQATIEQKIDNILEKLRDKTNAGRALLIRYHNGGKDLAGNSFLRFSCTNEKVSTGITSALTELRNQFRSLIGPLYDHLKDHEYYGFENVISIKEEGHITMYEFFKSRNVVSSSAMAVRTKKGYNLGFVAIEYLAEHRKEEEVKQALEEARDEIEVLLSLKSGG